MKYYLTVCVHCQRVHIAHQIDELPIPRNSSFMTRGWQFLPMAMHNWVNCHIFGEHLDVYFRDYFEGRVSIDGQKVVPR